MSGAELMICPRCKEKMIEIPLGSLKKDPYEGITQAFCCKKCDVIARVVKNPQGLDMVLSEILGRPVNGDWDKSVPSQKYIGKLKKEQLKGRTSQQWGTMFEEYVCTYLARNLKAWTLKRGEVVDGEEYDCLGWKGEPKPGQSPDFAIEMHFPLPKDEQSYYVEHIMKKTDKMVRKLEKTKARYKYLLIGIPRDKIITTWEQEDIKKQTGIELVWQEQKFSKVRLEKRQGAIP